ncbi:NAD(P)/FAD-dependent oxidoreductase [Cupriavidus gilardii]|uniref:NAD(P)/FAD-dependent oxidoreductase n=1 Tax=Cupriavidus gilardii TaxID=82541 RepID=UPI0020C64794|nr:NAD(P)/FAD-dependent oxidoreductase [Cupriavidus gilardii]
MMPFRPAVSVPNSAPASESASASDSAFDSATTVFPQSAATADYDVIVVGASFAGAACALAAARAGLRVAVLERKRDPGAKLHTTGIVVKEAAERTWLGRAPAHCFRRVEQVRLYSPALRSLRLDAPGYYFLTTDTPALMRWLVDELARHGVVVHLGTPFVQAMRDGDRWRIPGIGRTRYLVGADGAKSRVAAWLGLPGPRDFLYGIEYEFDGLTLPEPGALHCFVGKRFAPGYLGWAAQTPTGVQMGLALRRRRRGPRTPDIDGFLARVRHLLGVPDDAVPASTRAGLIPCGGPVLPLGRDGVLLAGDAAGVVSPVTAGGIHSAWEHGETIGTAIAAHLREGGPAPERAVPRATPRFRAKRVLRWLFDRCQSDRLFEWMLYSPPLRWAAQRLYFHRRRQRQGGAALGALD